MLTSLPAPSCLLSPTQSTVDAWACSVTLPSWIPALQPMMHSTVPSHVEWSGTHPPAGRGLQVVPPHVDSTNRQRFHIVSSPRIDPRHSSGSCDEIGATGLCYPSVLEEGTVKVNDSAPATLTNLTLTLTSILTWLLVGPVVFLDVSALSQINN